MIAMFNSSESNRSGAAPRTNAIRSASGSSDSVAARVATGQAEDVGLRRGNGQHPIAVARDQNRHIRQVLTHVLDDVCHVVDPLPCARIRQLGRLELLAHVPGPQPQLEPALGEIAQRADVAGQQRRLVEARVEDECAEAQRVGDRGGRHQHRKRRGRPEVVGHVQHVEAQFLSPARGVLNLRPRPGVVQTHPEPEVFDHSMILGSRLRCLAGAASGQS